MEALSLRRHLATTALVVLGSINMNAAAKMTSTDFGTTPDGVTARIFALTNKNGLEARITNYGGIVVSLKTPDRNGAMGDIVLGFDSLAGYISSPSPYLGALIGRYGNRIGHARFTLDGVEYKLAANN